jgi:broad specificity phosphatase PhoE
MATAPLVYLARHGQTAYNLEGRFQGHLPVPLDDTGRAQAELLGEQAASYGFVALICSSLARARETADIVARHVGLEPSEDARLVETDTGDWTDLSFAEVRERDPERLEAFIDGKPGFRFPGGESFAAQGDRVGAALAEIERAGKLTLVVCHGVVIRIALSQRRPEGLATSLIGAGSVPNGSLVALPAHTRNVPASGPVSR